MSAPFRTAVVFFPDWSVIAATTGLDESHGEDGPPRLEDLPPVVVLERHRVVALTRDAHRAGGRLGMRRRTVQSTVPDALVREADHDAEAALSELAATAVDTVASGVDIVTSGVVAFAAAGPARHWGGEQALAERTIDAVADEVGWECQVGIADGPLGALLAARSGRIVHPGRSREFLTRYGIDALQHALPLLETTPAELDDLLGVLERLGVRSLGDLADLDAVAVADRFGRLGAELHALARGDELHPPAARHLPQPIEVVRDCEVPIVQVDQAAFLARRLAEELHEKLRRAGCVCTRLRITAVTVTGLELERTWRHGGALTVADVVDRVRWQCDGWLTARAPRGGRAAGSGERAPGQRGSGQDASGEHAPDGGRRASAADGPIIRIGLAPDQVMPAQEMPATLWGGGGEDEVAAQRAFTRIQALRGEDGVLVPVPSGGRRLADAAYLVPWRAETPPVRDPHLPWPGRLTGPAPAVVFDEEFPLTLLDREGATVLPTARGALTGGPHVLVLSPPAARAVRGRARTPVPIAGWAGPWTIDERWWDPATAFAASRLQVLLEDGQALSLLGTGEGWWIEGWYE